MPKTATTPKTSRVIVRLTPELERAAEAEARQLGYGLSEWTRLLVAAAIMQKRVEDRAV